MKKKKRIILGVGYPWFGDCEIKPSLSRSIKLYPQRGGYGSVIPLKIKDSGALRKYKLILEEF